MGTRKRNHILSSLLSAGLALTLGLSVGACRILDDGFRQANDERDEEELDRYYRSYCGDAPDASAQSLKDIRLCFSATDLEGHPIQGKATLRAEIRYRLRGCLEGNGSWSVANQEITLDPNGRQCVAGPALNGVDWISNAAIHALALTTPEGEAVTGSVASYEYFGGSFSSGQTLGIEAVFDERTLVSDAYFEFTALLIRLLGQTV